MAFLGLTPPFHHKPLCHARWNPIPGVLKDRPFYRKVCVLPYLVNRGVVNRPPFLWSTLIESAALDWGCWP